MLEYLFNKPYNGTGQVVTQESQILWIPPNIFSEKFNEEVNYTATKKLKSLIETRKNILDKSLKSKKLKNLEASLSRSKKKGALLQKMYGSPQKSYKGVRFFHRDPTTNDVKLTERLQSLQKSKYATL